MATKEKKLPVNRKPSSAASSSKETVTDKSLKHDDSSKTKGTIGKKVTKKVPAKSLNKKASLAIKLKAKDKKPPKLNQKVGKTLLQNAKDTNVKVIKNGIQEMKPRKRRVNAVKKEKGPPVLEPIFPLEENIEKKRPKKGIAKRPPKINLEIDPKKMKVENEDSISVASDVTDSSVIDIPKPQRKSRAAKKPKVENDSIEDVMNDLSFLIKSDEVKKENDCTSESGKSDLVKPKKLTKKQKIEMIKKEITKKENIENTLSKLDSSEQKIIDRLDLNVKKVKKGSIVKRRHSIEKFPLDTDPSVPQLSVFSLLPRSISPRCKRNNKTRQSIDTVANRRSSPYTTRSDSPARLLRNGKHRKLKDFGLLDGLEDQRKRRRLCSDLSGSELSVSKLSGYESDSSFSDLASLHGAENADSKDELLVKSDISKEINENILRESVNSEVNRKSLDIAATSTPCDSLKLIDTNSNVYISNSVGINLNDKNINVEPDNAPTKLLYEDLTENITVTESLKVPEKSLILDIMKQAFNESHDIEKDKKNTSVISNEFSHPNDTNCVVLTSTFYGNTMNQSDVDEELCSASLEPVAIEHLSDIPDELKPLSPKKLEPEEVRISANLILSDNETDESKSMCTDQLTCEQSNTVAEDLHKQPSDVQSTIDVASQMCEVNNGEEKAISSLNKDCLSSHFEQLLDKHENIGSDEEKLDVLCLPDVSTSNEPTRMNKSSILNEQIPAEVCIMDESSLKQSENEELVSLIDQAIDISSKVEPNSHVNDTSDPALYVSDTNVESEIKTASNNKTLENETKEETTETMATEEVQSSSKIDENLVEFENLLNDSMEHLNQLNEVCREIENLADIPKPEIHNRIDESPEEPQISPEEPQISSEEPQISSEEKQISPEEPQISSEEPQISSEEPQISCEEPQISSEEPQISSEEPQMSSEEPQISSEEIECNNLENGFLTNHCKEDICKNEADNTVDVKVCVNNIINKSPIYAPSDEEHLITETPQNVDVTFEETSEVEAVPGPSSEYTEGDNFIAENNASVGGELEDKVNILQALGLQSLQAAEEARQKTKTKTVSRTENYTGTLKTVIKINRDKKKKKNPLKMTLQKKKVNTIDTGDGVPEDGYKIMKDVPTTSWKHGSQSSDSAGAQRKSHYANRSNMDASSDHTSDGETAVQEGAEKSLVIPEKASSFSIHPGRLCRDECVYCFGKFGLFDTPCHIGQIKSIDRQNKILATEKQLTRDSCLCDACYRHVDRKAKIPSYRNRSLKRNSLVAPGPRQNHCHVLGCNKLSSNILRRKWIIKMRKSICKVINIDLDNPGLHSIPICEEHYSALEHLMVCAMCRRRLARNHIHYLGPEINDLNNALDAEGIPLTLTDKPVVCKLCKCFASVILKESAERPENSLNFFTEYKKRLLHFNDIVPMDKAAAEEPIAVPSKDRPEKEQIKKKKKVKAFSNNETAISECQEGEKSDQRLVPSVDSNNQSGPESPLEDTVDYNTLIPSIAMDCGSDSETQKEPQKKALIIKKVPRLESMKEANEISKNIKLKNDKNSDIAVQRLGSNPSISVRQLFPGEEDLPLYGHIEFNNIKDRTPEGWEKCSTVIQYDSETKRLWHELQKPYGNQSSFLRHLILLEKYFRNGDLILSPSASHHSVNYNESVHNRLRAYDNIPTSAGNIQPISMIPFNKAQKSSSGIITSAALNKEVSVTSNTCTSSQVQSGPVAIHKTTPITISQLNSPPLIPSAPQLIHSVQKVKHVGAPPGLISLGTVRPVAPVIKVPQSQKIKFPITKNWRPNLIPIDPTKKPTERKAGLVQVISGGKPYHITLEDYKKMCAIKRSFEMKQKRLQEATISKPILVTHNSVLKSIIPRKGLIISKAPITPSPKIETFPPQDNCESETILEKLDKQVEKLESRLNEKTTLVLPKIPKSLTVIPQTVTRKPSRPSSPVLLITTKPSSSKS